ncbi:MAG: hypothetical protein AABZ55_11840 [Bdellovibrionota bacterium]
MPGSRYTSARGAAMGDAFLPLGDDGASALFYNPAIFGKLSKTQAEPLNLAMYLNSGFTQMLSAKSTSATSLSSYYDHLLNNRGIYSSEGFSFLPAYSLPGFGFGFLMQAHLGAIGNEDGSIRYRSNYQMIPAFGGGVRLAGGIIRLGYSAQWVNQASGNITTATPVGYNQQLAQGSALSHNMGATITFPTEYLPSLNVVARNVLGAHFSSFSIFPLARNPVGVPPDEPMTLDASFSLQFKMGSGSVMHLVFEDRDITNTSGVPQIGRLAIGTELNIRDVFLLRGGWGSGYPSMGFALKKKNGEFSITWYNEDVGTSYHSLKDTRYLLQYQVRVF